MNIQDGAEGNVIASLLPALQLLFYAFSFHPHLSDKSSIRIATFFIRSPEWTFLNSLWIRNRVEAKSGHLFLSGFVIRSSPVLHNEYSRWCWGQCYRFFITCTSVSRSITRVQYWYFLWWRQHCRNVGVLFFNYQRLSYHLPTFNTNTRYAGTPFICS